MVVLDLSAGGRRLVERVTRRRRKEIGQILAAVDPKERTNLIRAFTVFGKQRRGPEGPGSGVGSL